MDHRSTFHIIRLVYEAEHIMPEFKVIKARWQQKKYYLPGTSVHKPSVHRRVELYMAIIRVTSTIQRRPSTSANARKLCVELFLLTTK